MNSKVDLKPHTFWLVHVTAVKITEVNYHAVHSVQKIDLAKVNLHLNHNDVEITYVPQRDIRGRGAALTPHVSRGEYFKQNRDVIIRNKIAPLRCDHEDGRWVLTWTKTALRQTALWRNAERIDRQLEVFIPYQRRFEMLAQKDMAEHRLRLRFTGIDLNAIIAALFERFPVSPIFQSNVFMLRSSIYLKEEIAFSNDFRSGCAELLAKFALPDDALEDFKKIASYYLVVESLNAAKRHRQECSRDLEQIDDPETLVDYFIPSPLEQ